MKQPDILTRIVGAKRVRVENAKKLANVPHLYEESRSIRSDASPRFSAAFEARQNANIIAEIKRASPSKGLLAKTVDVAEKARSYENAGASAISVLTEEDFFLGSLDDMIAARAASSLPLLRKDFIFDEFQVYESALFGADAILLIAAMLDDKKLDELSAAAERLRMDALVEVHNEEEMGRAVDLGAALIGVNNRDLNSFNVDLGTSERLCKLAPEKTILISESGIGDSRDIERLLDLGFRGFLVGEALMISARPDDKLAELSGRPSDYGLTC